MTELEALRRVAEAARKWRDWQARSFLAEGEYALYSDVSAALLALDALPTPAAPATPTRSRLAALEALHAVVRDYDRGTGQDVRWADVRAALAAVDDSPAPAAEPEGEVVEVVADVFGDNDGFFVRERGHIPLPHNLHIATIRARVPLPRVPEVVGEVEG